MGGCACVRVHQRFHPHLRLAHLSWVLPPSSLSQPANGGKLFTAMPVTRGAFISSRTWSGLVTRHTFSMPCCLHADKRATADMQSALALTVCVRHSVCVFHAPICIVTHYYSSLKLWAFEWVQTSGSWWVAGSKRVGLPKAPPARTFAQLTLISPPPPFPSLNNRRDFLISA